MLTTAAMAHALRIHSSEGTSSCPQSMDGVYISNAISSRGGVAGDDRSGGFPANLPAVPGRGVRPCQMAS